MEEDSKRLSEEEEGEEEKGLMAFPLIAPLPAPIPTLMAPHPVSVPGAPFPHGARHGAGDRDPEGSGTGTGSRAHPDAFTPAWVCCPCQGVVPKGGDGHRCRRQPPAPPIPLNPPVVCRVCGVCAARHRQGSPGRVSSLAGLLCLLFFFFFLSFYQCFSLFEERRSWVFRCRARWAL